MRKAQSIKEADDTSVESEFKARKGWLENFMKRNGLSLRRRTTQAKKNPSFLIDKLVAYNLQTERLFRTNLYSPCNMIAMDETAVWGDMLSDTTVDRIGVKTVNLKTTGHEKLRVAVCLAEKRRRKQASTDGRFQRCCTGDQSTQ